MNNTISNDIKVADSGRSSVKRCFAVGQNIVVVLDKKLVQEPRINEENTLIQQELTKDGILLKIRRDGQY